MASNSLGNLTQVLIYVNGNLMGYTDSIKIDRTPGLLPGFTIAKGFAGATKGAAHMTVAISNLVPDGGFEYDAGADMQAANPITLTLVAASQTLTADSFATGDDLSFAVNQEAKQNINFICEYAQWLST